MNRHEPPGPPNGFFGLAHMAPMRRDLVGFGARLQRDHGDVAYFRLGPLPCYQLTHPEHIHEVLVRQAKKFRKPARLKQVFGRFEGNGLVVSDGDLWARQRRLVQPAFQASRLHTYTEAIDDLTREMLDGWETRTEVDIRAEMRRIALYVVARTLFSARVSDVVEPLGEAVDALQEWSIRELNRVVATPRWLPLFGQPAARRALAFLDRLVWRIIRERRAASEQPDDLLGRLLEAVDATGDGKGMSDRQLRDEMVTLLLAGHETTAVGLCWTVWLLARHPETQEQLESVEATYKEALRLYPPIYFFSREVAESVRIAGYELRPPSQVFLSPYLTQRDPRWFADPERFDPGRFTPENEAKLPPCAWFPFGAGPRACVGRGFALMESTRILSAILRRYRLKPAEGQGEPEREWQLSLHPKGPVRLHISRR